MIQRSTVRLSVAFFVLITTCYYLLCNSCSGKECFNDQIPKRFSTAQSRETTEGDSSDHTSSTSSELRRPVLYVVTPTYKRLTQIPDLVRLKQTLLLVTDCIWIVVEDANQTRKEVYRYIHDYPRLIYLHEDRRSWTLRGLFQRNRALREIVSRKLSTNGVLYFADDDNSYNYKFLDKLRWVKTVAVFNVGLIGGYFFEGPITEQGKVVGWRTPWPDKRHFCIDMAGFAINLRFVYERGKTIEDLLFKNSTKKGHLEDSLLSNLGLQLTDLEVLTGDKLVNVWHTQTVQPERYGQLQTYTPRLNTSLTTL